MNDIADEFDMDIRLDPSKPNTLIEYLYRDRSNNKARGLFVLAGALSEQDVRSVLSRRGPDGGFIPSQIGMPDLQDRFAKDNGWLEQDDHPWHTIESIVGVVSTPHDLTTAQFLAAWPNSAEGWEEEAAVERHASP